MAIATPNDIGGYDCTFVDTPQDRFLCIICQFPSRDPYLSVCCGHLFCKSCLDNVKKAAVNNACPVCRNVDFATFPNKAVDREIRSFLVYCVNKDKGCEWQGELNDINNHLGKHNGCQFEEVKCSNECGKMMERQYLTIHIGTVCPRRKVSCQYCHDTGEHWFINGQHKEECPNLLLPCPNNCEVGSVPRKDIQAHRMECSLEMIKCEYCNVGCDISMARKDQEKHEIEGMREHLMKTKLVMSNELNTTKLELTTTKHELADTKAALADTESKLTDINNQLTGALQHISTLEVLLYLTTNKAVFKPNNSTVVLESSLSWFNKLVTMEMMSKSGDQECPVILKLPQFSIKRDSNDEWLSNSFYTHNEGYRMSLRVDAAGHRGGKGSHVAVYMCLMKGEHDDKLVWPLRGTLEIKLLNQISDHDHHLYNLIYDDNKAVGRVTGDCDIVTSGWGTSKFICSEEVYKSTQTCRYIKDDCLFFQVTKL